MKSLLFILILSFSQIVSAAIIDKGNFTRDTSTNLDWLDLTETTNLSYNYVVSQMGAGGTYEDWRYASIVEFENLMFNFGAIDMNCTHAIYGSSSFCGSQDTKDVTLRIQELLGYTYEFTHPSDPETFGTQRTSSGILADTIGTTDAHWVSHITTNTVQGYAQYYTFGQSYLPDHDTTAIGSFLVRSAIPVPASAWLFGSALLGLITLKRKH